MHPFCLILLFGFAFADDFEYGCSSNPYVTDAGPLVKTSSGSLVGKHLDILGSAVDAFLGIPYAQPPVNEKRFLRPTPHDGWEGILEATTKPPPCMQYSSRNYSWNPTSTPSEDCLYLNVWTPAKCCCSFEERLPVLVWIYGGGFYAGSTDMDVYDGSAIASLNKAIIVSINYRVGIFGFLNSGSEEAPGNVGLYDQNLALKWIKSNIGYFGGDPDKITIMGESAGAWSVSLHLISPMSRNLFNSAIIQSGTVYHPQLVDDAGTAFYKANNYAKIIGCLPDDSSIQTNPEVMKCLMGKSSEELAKAEDAFTSLMPQYFLPTYGNKFLPTAPMKTINEGHIAPVDVLIGNNQNEATIFLNYIIPDIFKQDTEPQLNLESAKAVLVGLFKLVAKPNSTEIYEQYFQNASDWDSNKIVETVGNAFADYVFNCPTYFFAEKVRNAYFYWFTHRSAKEKSAKWMGVPHFYEVPFLFGAPLKDTSIYTAEDKKFSADLIKKWTEFAKSGYPLGNKDPETWPLFTAEDPVVFELNPTRTNSLTYPRAEACEFWRPYLAPEDC